ncbi:MAG: PQQ-like beta-propeller repeat protein, partial [Planctomycetales bacterium]|nr:PQQ-like beta-propeller repeat protein [Planctomycetales bacterium]
PLAIDKMLIVSVGGTKAGVIALDPEQGNVRWKTEFYEASYSSPIAVNTPIGKRILIETRLSTLLLNPGDGQVLGKIPFGSRGPTVNAATPIQISPNTYLLTANYGVGTVFLSITGNQLEPTFRSSTLLSSQYNTPIAIGSRVIGIDGREDVGVAALRAIDTTTRSVVWERPGFGPSHLIAINREHALAVGLRGRLALLDGQADDYHELAAVDLPSGVYRALPALGGRHLIVRRTLGPTNSELLCVELPQP